MTQFENRIDALARVSARGEGILSISLAPRDPRDFPALVDEVGFLRECGMDQLLMLFYEPEAMGVANVAPAEIRALKAGTAKTAWREAFFDSMAAVRAALRDLAHICSTVLPDIVSYGQRRCLRRCFEVGVDAIDPPNYRAIEDPVGLVEDSLAEKVPYIYSVMCDQLTGARLSDPAVADKLGRILRRSFGELFVVPAVSGTVTELKGEAIRPLMEQIKELLKRLDVDPRIIAISGINTPQDAYEMTHVAGAHGVHFSSAYLKRAERNMPRSEIAAWLRQVKDAMRR